VDLRQLFPRENLVGMEGFDDIFAAGQNLIEVIESRVRDCDDRDRAVTHTRVAVLIAISTMEGNHAETPTPA
jgi:hypothetical protein